MDLWQLFLILSTTPLALSLIFLLMKPYNLQNFPPSPRKLPILGNLHQVAGDISNVRRLAKKHGPLMLLQLGSARTLVISSAKMAKEVFDSNDLVFSGRPPLYVAKKLSYGCSNIAFSHADEHWKAVKRIVTVELLSMKKIQAFHAIREEEVAHMIDSIVESRGVVDVSQVTLALASNVLCRAVFGTIYTSSGSGEGSIKKRGGRNKLQELLLETQVLLGEFNVADFYPWFGWLLNKINGLDLRLENNFKKLDSFFEDVIEEHLRPTRPKVVHDDLLDVLLRVQKDPNQPIKLSKNNIKGDMFIAGSDPAWATLVWAMAQLVKNPSAMKRAQEEVREAANGKSRVDETDLRELTYLRCVIQETLRLHPPNPFPRQTTAGSKINGFDIPAGTRVYVDAKAIGRDGEQWERPDAFEPERFARCSTNCLTEEYSFIPFGVGRRGCPGRGFAMAVMEVALANMLHCFDWKLPAGSAVDMAEAVGLTTHKTLPLVLVATTPSTN
ncbi:hypothetical protein V2J09_017019 [Rumex salicifolius]